ncbi:MAG: 2-dehydropantoate 2-reductase [Pseudomonadota bacterium]
MSHDTWYVLGPGAVGSLWAASLALDDRPVVLIGRRPADANLRLLADGAVFNASIERRLATELTGPIRRLLITTKAPDTLGALDSVRTRLADDAVVLVLQNGMVATRMTLETGQRLLAATTTDGVYFEQPGTLVHAGRGYTDIGSLDGALTAEDVAGLIDTLPTRLDIRYCADIRTRLWQKLALNCAINPLCAKYDCRNGELLDNQAALAQLSIACVEISQVAHALDLGQWFDDVYEHCLAVLHATARNVNSMLQDLRAGRPTEIRELNGFLCHEAQRLGIPLPLHREFVATVEQLEKQSPWEKSSPWERL